MDMTHSIAKTPKTDSYKIADTNPHTTLVVPKYKINCYNSDRPTITADTNTKKLCLRDCRTQNYLSLNCDEIARRYGEAGKVIIQKLSSAINKLNDRYSDLNLIWDKEKTALRILGSAEIPTSIIREAITNYAYDTWYPHLSKEIDEDYEITIEVKRQSKEECYQSIQKIIPIPVTQDDSKHDIILSVNTDSQSIKNAIPIVRNQKFTSVNQADTRHDTSLSVKIPSTKLSKKNYISGLAVGAKQPFPFNENHKYSFSDSTSYTTEYVASYANTDPQTIKNAIPIGNQKFIPVNSADNNFTVFSDDDEFFINFHQLEYIVTFLKQNKHIKYIVDIGCGKAYKSLLLQKLLVKAGLDVTVIPVDIARDPSSVLPFNLLPAQQIKGADPSLIAFTVIYPFVGNHEILKDDEVYYILALIKNNPGCFVLTTENNLLSTPSHNIPSELVYTKILFLPNSLSKEQEQLQKINKLFEELPKNKSDYLAEIQQIIQQERNSADYSDRYDQHIVFNLYAQEKLKLEGVDYHSFIEKTRKEAAWWLVYQQTI